MQEVQTVSRPAATSRTAVEREARQQASITYRVVLPATEPKTVEPDVENYDATYWYHPSIHNWGNIGWRGRFHATFAPLATWVIDQTSYSGIDVRRAQNSVLAAIRTSVRSINRCVASGGLPHLVRQICSSELRRRRTTPMHSARR